MVNFDMGIAKFRGGEYNVFAGEFAGRPSHIIAIIELKKGQWKLESVVKHICKVASNRLGLQKSKLTPQEIAEIIALGKEFAKADPRYRTLRGAHAHIEDA